MKRSLIEVVVLIALLLLVLYLVGEVRQQEKAWTTQRAFNETVRKRMWELERNYVHVQSVIRKESAKAAAPVKKGSKQQVTSGK